MKKIILIITACIMMIVSGTQTLPEETVSEIQTAVEEPDTIIMELEETAEPEPEPIIPFQPIIESSEENETPQECFIPTEPDPQENYNSDESEQNEELTVPAPAEEKPEMEAEIIAPTFDVSQHVSFAQSYGTDIGLILDSTAVSCWDNPIAAHSGCIYIDRDLRDLLDWYRICGYTYFWVWSEDLGNGSYNIYLGYA